MKKETIKIIMTAIVFFSVVGLAIYSDLEKISDKKEICKQKGGEIIYPEYNCLIDYEVYESIRTENGLRLIKK